MRPETGNKPSITCRKVSIQQPLDGHSFSIPGDVVLGEGQTVEVELLSAHTMLVPEALYESADPEVAAAWFAMSGMPLADDECVVATAPAAERLALIGVNRDLLTAMREKWGDGIRFTTPLLYGPAEPAKCVRIVRTHGLTYIKVYDSDLQFAEVLPWAYDTDLLYFIDRLSGFFLLNRLELRVSGDNAKAVRRLVGKRFKKVICE